MAQRAETTVTVCSLTSCVWARFLIGSHTMLEQRHSKPTPTSLGQRYACLRVTCHLHFWHDRGLLRATVVTRGVERTPNKSQHTKLTPEKKILPPLLPGFELATFRSRVRRSNQQAISAPQHDYYKRFKAIASSSRLFFPLPAADAADLPCVSFL